MFAESDISYRVKLVDDSLVIKAECIKSRREWCLTIKENRDSLDQSKLPNNKLLYDIFYEHTQQTKNNISITFPKTPDVLYIPLMIKIRKNHRYADFAMEYTIMLPELIIDNIVRLQKQIDDLRIKLDKIIWIITSDK